MRLLASSMIIALLCTGCSSQQLFTTGQAWQRQQCDRLADAQDRQRCLERAAVDYDRYRRESGQPAETK